MAARDEVLELAVGELRRKYDKICTDYDNARVKILTLMGGGLVFLSFIYAPRGGQPRSDLFFPHNLDSQIFYVIGLVLTLGALGLFFKAFTPTNWALPAEAKEMKRLGKFKSKADFLTFLVDEYN